MSNNVVLNMKQTRDAGQIYRSQGILGKFFDRAYHVTGLGLSKDTVDIDKKLDITTSRKTAQKLRLI